MYKIIKDGAVLALTESPNYIRLHPDGFYILCDQSEAQGVAYHGTPYLFADGAICCEVDGGAYFFSNQEDMKSQLQQADDTAIELYEAHMAQEEINTAQDDALIELYERLEA